MNKHLKEFLQLYLDWAILGAPETEEENPHNLNRSFGLCCNLNGYIWMMTTVEQSGVTRDEACIIEDELGALFTDDDLDEIYPFGEDEFHNGCEHRTHHMNHNRINWIRKQLEK